MRKFVRPKNGATVRIPELEMTFLPEEGAELTIDDYVRRRLAAGELVYADAPGTAGQRVSQPGKPASSQKEPAK